MGKEAADPSVGRSKEGRPKPPPFRPDRRLITYMHTSRSPEEVRAIIERDEAAVSEDPAPAT